MRRLRLLGMLLTSAGGGMLIVFILPCWGFVAAALLLGVGIYLLMSNNC